LLGYGYPALTSVLHYEAKLKPENICLIGIRSFEEGEAELLKKLNVRVYLMEEVNQRGFTSVLKEAIEKVKKHTYAFGISLDIDAIDPEDAPAVDVPEEKGIHLDALQEGWAAVINDKKLVATEIVEFNPLKDKNQRTEKLIVSLLEMLAK